MSERRALIQHGDRLPVSRQCRLLALSRSAAYYQVRAVSEGNLRLMRAIDESHLEYPCYVSRRIRDELTDRGHGLINRERKLANRRTPYCEFAIGRTVSSSGADHDGDAVAAALRAALQRHGRNLTTHCQATAYGGGLR